MKIPVGFIAVLSIAFSACANTQESRQIPFIAAGVPEVQSRAALDAHWQKLDAERRREIETSLVMRLGLSSTGSIRLIGVYRQIDGKDDADKTLFHFQQLDLMGIRLLWSALVDPDAATARVLYHVDAGLVTREPVPLGRR
jgi:hypothetical protein